MPIRPLTLADAGRAGHITEDDKPVFVGEVGGRTTWFRGGSPGEHAAWDSIARIKAEVRQEDH
jgi:tRNA-dihydrouridine synthase